MLRGAPAEIAGFAQLYLKLIHNNKAVFDHRLNHFQFNREFFKY